MILMATNVFAQDIKDVPAGHWAYDAVNSLAGKYIEGYPDGKFLGDRTLSRYEFAVVIKRIIDNLEKTNPTIELTKPITTAPDTTENTNSNVKQEDLDEINRLIEEFRLELTVIGTRLDKVESDIEEIKGVQDNHNLDLYDEEGTVQTLKKDVSNLKKVKFSGYVQARYAQTDDTSAMQNGFSFRRIRMKTTYTPVTNTEIVVSADFAKLSQSSSNTVELKDAYIKWTPSVNQFFQLGQENVTFGHVIAQSSSARETPERPLISQQLFKGERDKGIYYQNDQIKDLSFILGWFNGTGPNNTGNTHKPYGDLSARVLYNLGDAEIGASYWYSNKSTVNGVITDNSKDRYGFDFRYYMNKLTLKAEYMNGKNVDGKYEVANTLNKRISGWYAQLAYNPIQKLALVANYEEISDMYFALDGGGAGTGKTNVWHLGTTYDLNDYVKLKLFYDIYDGYKKSGDTDKWDNNKLIAECMVKF